MSIPRDTDDWPESWKTIEYKEYLRMPTIDLPKPLPLPTSFETVLKKRESRRLFDNNKDFSLENISSFLFWGAGMKNDKENTEKRHYPSGGARYPLEVYLSLQGSEELKKGVYHYNVKKHVLEYILNDSGDERMRSLPSYPWAKHSPALVIITATYDRTMRKYKERGYRFINIETGVLLHNFYLVAEALELGCCGLGVAVDKQINTILELDENIESHFIHFGLGPYIK